MHMCTCSCTHTCRSHFSNLCTCNRNVTYKNKPACMNWDYPLRKKKEEKTKGRKESDLYDYRAVTGKCLYPCYKLPKVILPNGNKKFMMSLLLRLFILHTLVTCSALLWVSTYMQCLPPAPHCKF